ncbi:hypothetical protein [Haloechinothrix salitolerans]|uniref:Uncharacterized protein n=1 Tax=Haloechinothrix salitolerans TaxID=926830 RepID=A0ABW2BWY7_9PSEU
MSIIEDEVVKKYTEALQQNEEVPTELARAVAEELTTEKGPNSERLAKLVAVASGSESA